jgi:hypothetical protein
VTGAGFVSSRSLLRAGLTGERPSAWKNGKRLEKNWKTMENSWENNWEDS